MSRAARRRLGRRERIRRNEAALRRILALEREGFAPQAIADATQLSTSYVTAVIGDFHRFRRDRRAGDGGGR